MKLTTRDILRLKAETDLKSTIDFLWELKVDADKEKLLTETLEAKYKLLKSCKQTLYNILGVENGI